MRELIEAKIVSKNTKTFDVFEKYFPDILSQKHSSASELVKSCWATYPSGEKVLNGNVFESIIAATLYREDIKPIYAQVKMAFIPNVDFDFVLYSKECGPIVLSTKTSLRERYKQADLEGMCLRNVHRKALSYLITANEDEAKTVNNKIKKGEVLGLDRVIFALSNDFDELITELKKLTMEQPPTVKTLESSRVIA